MNKIKWTMRWLLICIILISNNIRKIGANSDALTSKQSADCHDPYGRPQVSIISCDFYRLTTGFFPRTANARIKFIAKNAKKKRQKDKQSFMMEHDT